MIRSNDCCFVFFFTSLGKGIKFLRLFLWVLMFTWIDLAKHVSNILTFYCPWIVHETATYRYDDTRGCVMQFWPPDDEHMCSIHVEAWNKLIVKQKSLCIKLVNYWDKWIEYFLMSHNTTSRSAFPLLGIWFISVSWTSRTPIGAKNINHEKKIIIFFDSPVVGLII